jgi:uncharacterized protein (TIGR02118 family)
MSDSKLIALYPHPTDIDKFNQDYENHMKLLHEKLQLPEDVRPYSVMRFVETPLGKPVYYQMFTFNFPSIEAMQQGLSNPAMLALAEDANRISSGGAPIFMVGIEV